VFDTKGDYLKEFYADGDFVIGIDRTGPYSYVNWNLFEDIRIEEEGLRVLAADEILSTLFRPSMEKSTNPFFPKAARDVVLALVTAILEDVEEPSNADLKRAVFGSREEVITRLKSKKDWSWVLSYIPEGSQGWGVFGEIYANMRPLLQEPFDQAGTFSIRKFVRERGGKALFFEYSLNTSMILKPLFSTLYDFGNQGGLVKQGSEGKDILCYRRVLTPTVPSVYRERHQLRSGPGSKICHCSPEYEPDSRYLRGIQGKEHSLRSGDAYLVRTIR